MAINYYLTPHFQVVFRDETGVPLKGGSVYFYKNSDKVTLKAVYQDKFGTPLPNPVPLNDAGIISDASGTPRPIYYADDEDYYIEAYRLGESPPATPVQTVSDFNSPLADFPIPSIETSNLTNYVLNPQFRFFQKQQLSDSDLVSGSEVSLAEEGWFFYRDTANSTNEISFVEFAAGQTDVPYNPRYYLKFNCSVAGAEARKDLCLPFRDVISFSGQATSHAWWVRSETGLNSTIQLVVRQIFGAGGSSFVETVLDTFVVTTSWSQIALENYTIPSVVGKTIGSEGDDRFEYCLRLPLNQIAIIGIVNGQLNISEVIYDFNYTSSEEENLKKKAYELPDPTPEKYGYPLIWNGTEYNFEDLTGQVEQYVLGDQPKYTLPFNNLTYIRTALIPNTPITYDRLYQKWDNDSDLANGNAFGYGGDGFFPTLYTNTAIFTNTNSGTVTDWADFNTGFTITTTQQSGTKGFSVVFKPYRQLYSIDTLRVTNTANGDVTDTSAGDSGFTVTKVQDGDAGKPEISDIQTKAASTLSGGEHFLISSTTANYYPWYKVDGVGTDPAIGGRTGILIELEGTDNASFVAHRTIDALNGHEISKVVCNAASTLTPGDYFFANSVAVPFYVWYEIDGVGVDPAVIGKTGIKVAVLSTDTDVQLAQKTSKAISSYYFVVPDWRGFILRNWANGSTNDPNRNSRIGINGNVISGDHVGTAQTDEGREHLHTVNAHCTAGTQNSPCGHYPGKDTVGAPWMDSYSGYMASNMINTSGGSETRMLNAYVLFAVRY